MMIGERFLLSALIAGSLCAPALAQGAPSQAAMQGNTAPAAPSAAAGASPCEVPPEYLTSEGRLPHTAAAIKAGKLSILVLGSRSSSLGSDSKQAYPGQLQVALEQLLPKVETSVIADVQPRKTAEDIEAGIGALIIERKPSLLIWQTGTVDAMRGIDVDDFRNAVDAGLQAVLKGGSDVILLNLQYSPRTQTMIDGSAYRDTMRVASQQYAVPLFDRYEIMRHWHETGVFDLFSPTRGSDLARRVHECLGRALAAFVIDRAAPPPTQGK